MIKNFKNLEIWRQARSLVKEVYVAVEMMPSEEIYGLSSQIKRSAVSIPSNIAEGCGRASKKELGRFLQISIGSSCELETQLYLASDLNFLSEDQTIPLVEKTTIIRKMTYRFMQSLNQPTDEDKS
jgi:four helix bundle protein